MEERSAEGLAEQATEVDAEGGGATGNEQKSTAGTGVSAAAMRRAMRIALNSYAEAADIEEEEDGNEEVAAEVDENDNTTSAPAAGATSTAYSSVALVDRSDGHAETQAAAQGAKLYSEAQRGQYGSRREQERGRSNAHRSGTSPEISVLGASTTVSPAFTFSVDIDTATGGLPASDLAQIQDLSGAATTLLRTKLRERILQEQQQGARNLSSLTLEGISVNMISVSVAPKNAFALEEDAENEIDDAGEVDEGNVGAEGASNGGASSAFTQQISIRHAKNRKQKSIYASFCELKEDALNALAIDISSTATFLSVVLCVLFVLQFFTLLYLAKGLKRAQSRAIFFRGRRGRGQKTQKGRQSC
eukprot:g7600.t1